MLRLRINLLVLVCICVGDCFAQGSSVPVSSPPPASSAPNSQQETVKVFTEEVVLTAQVTDQQGRFDPTLHKDELLILEEGVHQEIMSARQVPASVLLLISTGGELNPAMKSNISKEVAAHFVSRLKTGDRLALVQYGRQVQTITKWTSDLDAALHSIRTKLSSNNGSNLADALAESVEQFAESPTGNRHLVLITDGVDDSSERHHAARACDNAVARSRGGCSYRELLPDGPEDDVEEPATCLTHRKEAAQDCSGRRCRNHESHGIGGSKAQDPPLP